MVSNEEKFSTFHASHYISPLSSWFSLSPIFSWPNRGLDLSGWALHSSCLLESWRSIDGGRQTCSCFTESRKTRRTGLSRTTCVTPYTLWSSLTGPTVPCHTIKTWRTCERQRQDQVIFKGLGLKLRLFYSACGYFLGIE